MTTPKPTDLQEGMQNLDCYPFDTFEVGLLAVTRHFLDALRCPETHAWHQAYTIAAERWGDRIGLPAAHLLARFVKFVIRSRNNGFDHIDPFCRHRRGLVTPDEAMLLLTLHYMRRDDTPAARQSVENLTKGLLDPDVIRSGLTFANRFPAGPAAGANAHSGVRLRVVG